jgi:peptidoglycan/LPS O-acetylase OafA/YrhL
MNRSTYFDFVRGISAQLVLIGHALNMYCAGYFMTSDGRGGLVALPDKLYVQGLGVLIFFTLSGFLVTTSALSKPADVYGFRDFFLDRAVRIFVPFLPALTLIAIADYAVFYVAGHAHPFVMPMQNGVYPWAMNALMLFDHPVVDLVARLLHRPDLAVTAFGSAAPFWTVIIEWWLYITFGLSALVLARFGKLGIGGSLLLIFAAAVPLLSLANGSGLVLAWIVGMVFAMVPQFRRLDRRVLWIFAVLVAVIAISVLVRQKFDFYNPIVCAGVASLILFGYLLIEGEEPAKPVKAPQTAFSTASGFISNYSYSLYLVHFSLLTYLYAFGLDRLGAPLAFAVAFLSCNAAAIVFWYLFERRYKVVRNALHVVWENRLSGRSVAETE